MKKTVICILAVVLLTGCSNKAETPEKVNKTQWHTMTFEKTDGTLVKEDEVKELTDIEGVTYAEWYGMANKVNYYYKENEDYKFEHHELEEEETEFDVFTPLDNSNYICSSEMISEKDLAKGTLPKNSDEIVLYSADKKMLNQKITLYFFDMDMLGESEDEEDYSSNLRYKGTEGALYGYGMYTVKREFTVTGLLKKNESQIYFQKDFCQMMGNVFSNFIYTHAQAGFYLEGNGEGIVDVSGKVKQGEVMIRNSYGELHGKDSGQANSVIECNDVLDCIVLYNDSYDKDEVRLSEQLINTNNFVTSGSGQIGTKRLYNVVSLSYVLPIGTQKVEQNEQMEDVLDVAGTSSISGEGSVWMETYLECSAAMNPSGAFVLETGKTLYDRLYGYDGSREVTLFAESEEECAQIQKQMEELGYKLYEKPKNSEIYDAISLEVEVIY